MPAEIAGYIAFSMVVIFDFVFYLFIVVFIRIAKQTKSDDSLHHKQQCGPQVAKENAPQNTREK